jgi:hypothetical protein
MYTVGLIAHNGGLSYSFGGSVCLMKYLKNIHLSTYFFPRLSPFPSASISPKNIVDYLFQSPFLSHSLTLPSDIIEESSSSSSSFNIIKLIGSYRILLTYILCAEREGESRVELRKEENILFISISYMPYHAVINIDV